MKTWPIYIFLVMVLISCEKELDFKYHDIEPIFVIEGKLSQNGAQVTLTQTTPMDEPIDTVPITDAEVNIKDLTHDAVYPLEPDPQGIFRGNFPTYPGHIYKLSITRKKEFYEAESLMYPAVEITDLNFNWIKMPYGMVAVLNISFRILGDKDACYWTRIYKNGSPYKWQLSHGSGAVDGILTQSLFTTRKNPDDEDDRSVLHDGDILEVVITGISLEMYDYLTAIQSDSNGKPMFEGDFCLGYFLASQEAKSSISFHED